MKVFGLLILTLWVSLVSFGQSSINLYSDSSHVPFIYGVASGDPTDTSLIIWTAVPDDTSNTSINIIWQIATDSTFGSIIKSDSVTINTSSAYTLKVDVKGLQPYTKYCYRFLYQNQYSDTGFTETAPRQTTDSLKFALVSCSSLFSGYFNAYRQIARNTSIDAVIHVGDFIYDFVDPQERVRIPQPNPADPTSLEDWRNRYRLYFQDPDLREARKRHPWIQIWDNHDLNGRSFGICAKAFFEMNPVRIPSADSTRIWRKLSFGPMADIFLLDDWQYAGVDTFANGEKKMLNNEQLYWLLNGIDSSTATWKLMCVSKLFSPWELGSLGSAVAGGFDNSWIGYPQTRDSVLGNFAQHQIKNPVVLSGDLHMNILSDLAKNPFDSSQYDRATGNGGLGIEINGASVSRGNLDESGVPRALASTLNNTFSNLNPQQQYLNLFDHGYALLTINRDSLVARMMLCSILQKTDSQTTDAVLYCRANDNHWLRKSIINSISTVEESDALHMYPNPSLTGQWILSTDRIIDGGSAIEIYTTDGQLIYERKVQSQKTAIELRVTPGVYLLRYRDAAGVISTKLIKF